MKWGGYSPPHSIVRDSIWSIASSLGLPLQERRCHTGAGHPGKGLQPVMHQERTGLVQSEEVLPLTVHSYLLGGCVEHSVRCVLDRMWGKRPKLEQGKFQVNARKNIGKEHARLWSRAPERRWHLWPWRCSEFDCTSLRQLGLVWLYSDHWTRDHWSFMPTSMCLVLW